MEWSECGFNDGAEESFYARRCRNCGFVFEPTKKLTMIEENEGKLKLLRQEVREIMRRRLARDGET